MIRATTFAGRQVAVFGLGRSGIATCRALADGGAGVVAWDDNESARAEATRQGFAVTDLRNADWSRIDALALSPGVPLTHPDPHWSVSLARTAGVEVIGDIEIFCRERAASAPTAPLVAITGTNGKSTTTALIAHSLRTIGADVQMGGNIGTAILSLEPPSEQRIHVIEVSSFQIDLAPSLAPTVGVLLNITPDHIERHGSFERYSAIKERLVAASDAACVGIDDAPTRAIADRIEPARLYSFSLDCAAVPVPCFCAQGATLLRRERDGAASVTREVASLAGARALRGRHNVQNALAAVAALTALQDRLDADGRGHQVSGSAGVLSAALASFPGLPHRLEEVGRLGRIALVNDSKATNADSTANALAAWERDIFWIVGGRPKEGGIASLAPYFPRISKAYLIGEATDAFAATLEGRVPFERCGTLEAATLRAAMDASGARGEQPVVLLSPACASYDQFKSFEHRGDRFRALVAALPGVVLPGRGA